MKGSLFR